MNRGRLFGVGVGPGDPELVTIKAIRTIQKAGVLIFPGKSKEECRAYNIVRGYLEDLDNKDIHFMPFPMIMDKDKLEAYHQEVGSLIMKSLDQGKDVAFMTIGDPTIYSTYSYVNQIVSKKGYETEIVNGISSINAVAAKLGISLADGSEMIHIVPGSGELEETLNYEGSRVYMKSGKQLKRLIDMLKEECRSNSKLKVMAVSNCGMDDETIYDSVDTIPVDNRYLMTIIVTNR